MKYIVLTLSNIMFQNKQTHKHYNISKGYLNVFRYSTLKGLDAIIKHHLLKQPFADVLEKMFLEVLKIFANFTGKQQGWNLFPIKLQDNKRGANKGVFLWNL